MTNIWQYHLAVRLVQSHNLKSFQIQQIQLSFFLKITHKRSPILAKSHQAIFSRKWWEYPNEYIPIFRKNQQNHLHNLHSGVFPINQWQPRICTQFHDGVQPQLSRWIRMVSQGEFLIFPAGGSKIDIGFTWRIYFLIEKSCKYDLQKIKI